jgi:hypothetical protein
MFRVFSVKDLTCVAKYYSPPFRKACFQGIDWVLQVGLEAGQAEKVEVGSEFGDRDVLGSRGNSIEEEAADPGASLEEHLVGVTGVHLDGIEAAELEGEFVRQDELGQTEGWRLRLVQQWAFEPPPVVVVAEEGLLAWTVLELGRARCSDYPPLKRKV